MRLHVRNISRRQIGIKPKRNNCGMRCISEVLSRAQMKKAPSSRHTKTNDGSRASWANVRNRQRTQKGINNGPNLIARPAEVQNVEVIFHRLSKKPLFQGPFVPLQTKKLARTHTKEKSRVVVLRARAATSWGGIHQMFPRFFYHYSFYNSSPSQSGCTKFFPTRKN
jgi:hypothetical protein